MNFSRAEVAQGLAILFKDLSSTAIHRELANRAAQVLARVPCVQAVLLKGSLVRGTGDAFSDVDLLVLQDDEPEAWSTIDEYLLNHLKEIGEPMHWYRSMVSQRDLLVYFRPWVMVEFDVRTVESSSMSWKTAYSEVLFDRSSLGEQVIRESARLCPSMEHSREEIERNIGAFCVVCTRVQGYYLRGELMTAHDDLAWLRDRMLWLSGAVLGLWYEGPRRAEGRFPDDIVQVWRRSCPNSDDGLPAAATVLIDWYEEWLTPRLKTSGINCPEQPVRVAREFCRLLLGKG
jgi:predicted nucleotidyltransferase